MRQVTMLPEDFNTLDTKSKEFEDQYGGSIDCPMTRALKRATGNNAVRSVLSTIHTDTNIRSEKVTIFDVNYVGIRQIIHAAKMVSKNGKFNFRLGVDISKLIK